MGLKDRFIFPLINAGWTKPISSGALSAVVAEVPFAPCLWTYWD